MIALVAAELNRLRSRRITLVTLLGVLLAVGLFQLAVNSAVSPPSAEETAAAQAQYQSDLREFEQNSEEYSEGTQQCMDMGGTAEECDPRPRLEWYLTPTTPFADIAPIALLFATLVAGLGTFLVAASFIGAEYTSGSISNWLTFIPQRWKVFTAKAVAVVLGAGLVGTVVVGAALALAAALTVAHGGELTGVGKMTASAARGVGLVVAMALISYALTLIFRHTAGAIGVLVGYGLISIVLAILYNFVPALQPLKRLQPENNLMAFLAKGHTYTNVYPTVEAGGASREAVERTISMTHGGLFWLLLTVVAVVAAFLVFRRRDVA